MNITRRGAAVAAFLAFAVGVVALDSYNPHTAPAPEIEAVAPGTHCGTERWAVKTGTDAAASQVAPTPRPATVAQLTVLRSTLRGAATPRTAQTETTTFVVHATLAEFKQEADSDYHLVLSDGGKTMIAEIPSPSCMGSSSFTAGVTAARAAFDKYPRQVSSATFTKVHQAVTVTGVGYFDRVHGAAGQASNGIELHPVLAIEFR